MSADIETRIRAALRAVPEPEGLGARLRAGALAGLGEAQRAPRRRRRPRLGRGLRWAGGAVAACAVAALLGLLLVATPSDTPTGDGRETAVEYVLRALPNRDGVTPEAAGAELADIVRARSDEIGARGVTVEADDDRVTVVVPGTHDVGWISTVIGELNLSVFDEASVIASGTVEEVAAAARAVAPGVGTPAWYVVAPAQPAPNALPGYLEGPFGSEAEAAGRARTQRQGGWTGARAESVPAGVTLAAHDQDSFLALRDPVVRPGDIEEVDARGAEITIVLTPAARRAVAARLAGGGSLTVVQGAATWYGSRVARYDAATGEIRFRALSPAIAVNDAARPVGLDALIAVEEARPVGPAPARRGQPADAFPEETFTQGPGQGFLPPREGSVLLALTTRHAGDLYEVYTWLAPDGTEVTGLRDVRGPLTTDCVIRPESDVIQPCAGAPRLDGDYLMLGRVRDGVESVRVVYPDGSVVRPAVANGVILAFLPRDREMPVRVEALDASGGVVGTVDPRTVDNRMIYGG
ncbi:MAG: hypothetical protein AB7V62_05625 [Thermoleophilia bacterium]